MRIGAFLTFLAALGAPPTAAADERAPETGALQRAYFRAESPAARRHASPYVTHEFPGGVVHAAGPPAAIEALAATPGLTLLGFDARYRPAPVVLEEIAGPPARSYAATESVRTCYLPDWIPPVGWGIRALYDDPGLTRPSGGAGVKVGVIDAGVAPHLDLVRRIAKCVDMTPVPDVPPCTDVLRHGTMVASVIAADGGADGRGMFGVAPEAEIYSYRVCQTDEDCWGAYIAAAIYQAIDDGVHIINLSLVGTGDDPVVREAIRAAQARNILFVAAAGNSPPYSYIGWPATYPEAMSVGAVKEDRAPWEYTAPGINDGDYVREDKEIEVAAPGSAVLAAFSSGCWVLGHGTSLAAPHIAGLAARLWNGDAAATRRRIQRAAKFGDVYVPGDDTLTGFGFPTIRDYSGFLAIGASAGPGGAVIPSGVVPVAPGATQTFTIAPLDGCGRIEDVIVDRVPQGPITSYTFSDVRADHTIRATFMTLGSFSITASAGPGGGISPGGVSIVPCGGRQTYTITAPPPGCGEIADVQVDGVSQGPITSYTFTNVTANHTIQATIPTLGPYTINASSVPGGWISPSGATTVACGGTRSYTITAPRAGCGEILDVKVDGVSQGPITSYTFSDVTASHTIEATIAVFGPFTIAASSVPAGVISPSGVASVPCGGSKSYTITPPALCGSIQNVIVDGVSWGPRTSFNFTDVRSDHTIHATGGGGPSFTINASAGTGGAISPAGTTTVPCRADRTYTITPDDCHTILRVYVDGSSRGPISTYTFSDVAANHTIAAYFSWGSYPINASAGTGGTLFPSGEVGVPCGGRQTYAITPVNDCHVIQDVRVDGVSRGPFSSYTFSNVRAGHSISASFTALGPFTIQASAGPGGTISPAGATSVTCAGGRSYTIAPADACHRIADVRVDGVSQGPIASYTFATLTADHTIEATFAPLTYTIQAGAGAGGTITPAGATSATCGESRTYAITPVNDCHVIQDVKVDGVSRGPITEYTFPGVTADHSIQATFLGLGPYTIQTNAGPGSVIHPDGATRVACGASQGYTIAPADACRVLTDVQVDGVSIGVPTEYVFGNVRGDHTIAATSAPSLVLAETHIGASWSGLSDGAIDLTVAGGVPPFTYAWSHGATSEDVDHLAAGAYEVVVTDAQGCTNRLSVAIANVGPAELALSRPSPNPARGSVRLRYGLPEPSTVRLSVVDVQGREVAVLARGSQPGGWSWAEWNGSTANGPAPAGIYFFRLESGARQIVHRFARVR